MKAAWRGRDNRSGRPGSGRDITVWTDGGVNDDFRDDLALRGLVQHRRRRKVLRVTAGGPAMQLDSCGQAGIGRLDASARRISLRHGGSVGVGDSAGAALSRADLPNHRTTP
jgi:hypothetical protein